MSDETAAQTAKPTSDSGPSTQALPVAEAAEAPQGATDARSSGSSTGSHAGSDRDVTSDTARNVGSAASASAATTRPPGDRRPTVPRPSSTRVEGRSATARGPRVRRARLALRRIDPWSVFLFSFLGSLCLGVVLLVAVAALFATLSTLGVIGSINDVFSEVTGGGSDSAPGAPLLTAGRALGAAAVLAAMNVVLLTALATLGALLYNLCAALTGGIEVTLAEKD